MSDSQIDDAILAAVEARLSKVAMVIMKVVDSLGSALPDGEVGHQIVANRIEILLRDGRLVAQGDIKRWRHSEVRRP